MSFFKCEHITVSFGGLRALDNINVDVNQGEIYSIIGPNGAGKTTLFNCVNRFYDTDEGAILFKDKDITRIRPYQVADLGISRTFQNIELFKNTTVLDNLLLGRHIKFKKNPFHAVFRIRREETKHREKVEELIDFLQLEAYRAVRISDCPYGVQKRAEIGRALATEPRMLMLDEPISGLTAEEKQETAYLINEIRGRFKPTILLVEHDLRLASALSDRMVALDTGIKIAEGTPEEVQRNPAVAKAYLGVDD